MPRAAAADQALELTEENVEKVLDEVSSAGRTWGGATWGGGSCGRSWGRLLRLTALRSVGCASCAPQPARNRHALALPCRRCART